VKLFMPSDSWDCILKAGDTSRVTSSVYVLRSQACAWLMEYVDGGLGFRV
jgi:hypothetical protein